jgi:hypothetical protein
MVYFLGVGAIRSSERTSKFGMEGKVQMRLDNWLSDAERNSQPTRWEVDSDVPRVATGPQSLKRDIMWKGCKPDAVGLLARDQG